MCFVCSIFDMLFAGQCSVSTSPGNTFWPKASKTLASIKSYIKGASSPNTLKPSTIETTKSSDGNTLETNKNAHTHAEKLDCESNKTVSFDVSSANGVSFESISQL